MSMLRRCVRKTLPAAANLGNLLPTGTVLVFQALLPSLSNGGACNRPANSFLTSILLLFCSAACFFSSFTDSIIGPNGKLYYGIATPNGLHILNDDPHEFGSYDSESNVRDVYARRRSCKLSLIDFVHAYMSLVVFLAFAAASLDVRKCFIGGDGKGSLDILVKHLPVGVGTVGSFLFVVFPTRRRGIGCTDMITSYRC